MICKNCNQQISDESLFCPYCGTAVEQGTPAPEAQPAPQPQQPVAQYQPQAQYQQSQPGQFYPNPTAQIDSEVDSAKTLGIVALIGAFFCPLVSYICGGIGLSKIKKLKPQANEQQTQKLASAKKLCVAGITVRTVLIVISIILTILLSVFAVKYAKKASDEIQQNPNYDFNYEVPEGIPDEYAKQFEDMFK